MSGRTTIDQETEPTESDRPAWRNKTRPTAEDGRGMTQIQGPAAIPAEDRGDSLDGVRAPREAPTPSDTRATEAAPGGAKATAPTPEQVSDHYAAQLAETSGAIFMYTSMASTLRQPDALAFKKYRDKLLAECGSPTDPIEVMIIEQLALSHLNLGRLQFLSSTSESLEGAKAYGGLAVLLMGEFRRTALALRTYRTPARPPAVAASTASQDLGATGQSDPIEEGVDTEQGSNPGGHEHGDSTIPLPEPQEGRGGAQESRKAARAQRRRA